jgi:hypothetical protein
MLIIGQPDKMLTDLRNSKGSTELSAMLMWIVVSANNHNVVNVVFSLCMSVLGLGTRYSTVTASLLQHLTLVAEATVA